MKFSLTKALILILALTIALSVFAACDTGSAETESNKGTETETESGSDELKNFDYLNADLTEYISLPSSDYLTSKVTLGSEYVVTDEMLDAYMADFLFDKKTKTNGDTQITDQPIKLGDSAFIYYTGYLDGVAFQGGSNASDSSPYELSIGSGSFIPGFEEGLIGIVPNSTSRDEPYDLHVSFPENYGQADLAGKAVIFKVWIEYTVQYTIPELTDEFVQNTVKYDGTAEEYRADIKNAMIDEAKVAAEEAALGILTERLLDSCSVINYPKKALDYTLENYRSQIQQYVDYYGMYGYKVTFEEMAIQLLGLKEGDDWEAELDKLAEDDVKATLIYYAIAADNNITATDDDVQKKAEELAEYYSSEQKTYTAEEIIKEIGADNIKQTIVFEGVQKLLIQNCTIEFED